MLPYVVQGHLFFLELALQTSFAKQVCQCVKIPSNSFPRFLEYYTTSFNSKAFCPCKLAAYEGNWLCSQPNTNYFSSPQLHQVLQKDVQNSWPEASGFGEAHTWTVPELLLLLPPSQNTAFTQLTQNQSGLTPTQPLLQKPVWPWLILRVDHMEASLKRLFTEWNCVRCQAFRCAAQLLPAIKICKVNTPFTILAASTSPGAHFTLFTLQSLALSPSVTSV